MHHIRRQRWQISAPDRETAFAIRSGVRQHLDALTATFERGFDGVDQRERVTHIPRLELHLRVSNANDLLAQLPFALAEQLSEAFLHLPAEDSAISHVAPHVRLHQILLQYLATGTIAWPELGIDVATQIRRLKEAAEAWLNKQVWQEFHRAAPNSFASAIPFFQRLLPLFDTHQRAQLHELALQALPQMDDPGYVRLTLIQALCDLSEEQGMLALNNHQQLYFQAMQLASIAGNHAPDIQELIELLRNEIGSTAAETFIRYLAQARIKQAPATSLANPQTPPAAGLPSTVGPDAAPEPAPRAATLAIAPENAQPNASILAALFQKPDATTDRIPGLRVHSAGLILLHPYLTHLFTACEIAFDEERIATHELPRAAALLHWLACGRDELFEFELGAVKPLLGLRPEDPLPVSAGLIGEREKEETHALLSAAIEHWAALGSTSPGGMQVSFLQRQGLLTDAGNHWQLQLESEAFDVLIAQLPWSISLIKLPWMTKPIFTDWPTR